jgi:hypothetical protein
LQELTRLLSELTVDDSGDSDMWTITQTPINTVVSAATRDSYPDGITAWEGARRLWRTILDLGHELTEEGESQIGAVVRRTSQGKGWRGKVYMVLAPA